MISPDEGNTSVLAWVVEVLTIIGGEECVDHMKKWLNFLGFLQWVSESDNTYATCSSTSLSLEPLPFYRCHVTQIDFDKYWVVSLKLILINTDIYPHYGRGPLPDTGLARGDY